MLKGAYLFESTVEANPWIVILLLPVSYHLKHIIPTINQFHNKEPLNVEMDIFELLLQMTFQLFFREQVLHTDENTIARLSDCYMGSSM